MLSDDNVIIRPVTHTSTFKHFQMLAISRKTYLLANSCNYLLF